MSLKLVYIAIAVALVLAGVGALFAFSQPRIPAECVNYDGFCTKGCTFENDTDCKGQELIQPGTITSCLSDADCVVLDAICNNEACVYTDNECRAGASCYTAINKNFESVWHQNKVRCIGELQELACPRLSEFSPKCMRGTCTAVRQ